MNVCVAPEEDREILNAVIDEWFPLTLGRCEPRLRIALLFASPLTNDGAGGFKVEVTADKERAVGLVPDVRIIIDFDSWSGRKDRPRRALLAAACYGIVLDGQYERDAKTGREWFQCKLDQHGRPKTKVRKADFKCSGYLEPSAWYGEDSPAIRSYRALGEMLGQEVLPFAVAPAPSGPVEKTLGETVPAGPVGAWRPTVVQVDHDDDQGDDGEEYDADDEAMIRDGLAEIEAACAAIEAEAERQATENPPDLADANAVRRALPITRLECSKGIHAALWDKAEVATVGELEDAIFESMLSVPATLNVIAGLDPDRADRLVLALDNLRSATAAAANLAPLESGVEPAALEDEAPEPAAKPKRTRKPKAAPAPDAYEHDDLFIYWSGRNPVYCFRAPSLRDAIEHVKTQHPKDARCEVKPDIDGESRRRKLPVMSGPAKAPHDAPTPPAGFVGSDVAEVFGCNRCNARRPCTVHPCPQCDCPEYRLESVPKAEAQRIARVYADDTTTTTRPKRSRKAKAEPAAV